MYINVLTVTGKSTPWNYFPCTLFENLLDDGQKQRNMLQMTIECKVL